MENNKGKAKETNQSNIYYVVLTLVVCLVFGAILVFTIGIKDAPDYNKQLQSSYALELNLRKQVMKNDTLRKYAQLDTLFAQWQTIMKQEQVVQKAESAAAEQNVAIWLAVIAAICTMLPIVIGINQNINFNRELDFVKENYDEKSESLETKISQMQSDVSTQTQQMEEKVETETQRMSSDVQDKMDNLKVKLVEEIEKQKNSTKKQLDELNKTTRMISLLSIINSLAITVRILSELEDLEIRQSVSLTCPDLLKKQLEKMVMYCEKCYSEYNQFKGSSLGGDNLDMVSDGGLGVLIMMHNLLKKYEVKFDGVALFKLHDLLDEIWKRIQMQVDDSTTNNKSRKVEEILSEAAIYAPRIKGLFEEQFLKAN